MSVVEAEHSPSDEVVAAMVQEGDQEAFGILLDRYEKKLSRYGRKFLSRKEDIQDIVQDVFVSAYQNIQSFDTSQRFSPWIYRIAHNALVNALRKKERSPISIDLDTLIYHPIYEDGKESEREQEEMKKLIEQGLEKLPPKYREVLILHYYEDMPYKDIADILQVPAGTVGIRLKRAKERLREDIKHKI